MGCFARSPGPIAPKPSERNVDQSTSTRNTCSTYIIEAMLRGMEPFGHLVCLEMARRMVRNRHFTSTSSRCKNFASLDLQCCSCEVGGHKQSKCRNPTYFMAVATNHGGDYCSHPRYASSFELWNTSSSKSAIQRFFFALVSILVPWCMSCVPVDLAFLCHFPWLNPFFYFVKAESKIPFSAPSTLATQTRQGNPSAKYE